MDITLTTNEFQLLRDLIEKECGIAVGEEKIYLIENRLAKLVAENGCDTFGEFYLMAKSSPNPLLKTKIIDAITTNETMWFRDEAPFTLFKEQLLPQFISQLKEQKKDKIRIWSAACSTGQEPYSLAMILEEYNASLPKEQQIKDKVSILATDISSKVLFLAQQARYDAISMSRGNILPSYAERYFEEQNGLYLLKDDIKKWVTFKPFNLQNSFLTLGQFDLILLRNVAIYFSTDLKRALFKKVAETLTPQGNLILGASESIMHYNKNFELKEYQKSVFYQLKSPERLGE